MKCESSYSGACPNAKVWQNCCRRIESMIQGSGGSRCNRSVFQIAAVCACADTTRSCAPPPTSARAQKPSAPINRPNSDVTALNDNTAAASAERPSSRRIAAGFAALLLGKLRHAR